MTILQEVLTANQRYAADFGDKGKLAMPPARHFAILTCMDARLDPAKFAGHVEGDAHIIIREQRQLGAVRISSWSNAASPIRSRTVAQRR